MAEETNVNTSNTDQSTESTVSKALFDRTSKELAELKRQLKSYMSADEQAKALSEEKDTRIAELEAYKRNSELTSGLVEHLGIEHSKAVSEAIIGGDNGAISKAITTAFTKMLKAKDDEIAELKLSAMNQGTSGANTGTGTTITAAEFSKMSIDERIKLKQENPELYAQLRKR